MNAIDVECPECGAKPGERCHTFTGKWQPVAHARRKQLAFDEETRRQGIEEQSDTASAPEKKSS